MNLTMAVVFGLNISLGVLPDTAPQARILQETSSASHLLWGSHRGVIDPIVFGIFALVPATTRIFLTIGAVGLWLLIWSLTHAIELVSASYETGVCARRLTPRDPCPDPLPWPAGTGTRRCRRNRSSAHTSWSALGSSRARGRRLQRPTHKTDTLIDILLYSIRATKQLSRFDKWLWRGLSPLPDRPPRSAPGSRARSYFRCRWSPGCSSDTAGCWRATFRQVRRPSPPSGTSSLKFVKSKHYKKKPCHSTY